MYLQGDGWHLLCRSFSISSQHFLYFDLKKLNQRLLLLFSHPVVSDFLQPIECSKAGLSVPHHLPKFAQVHVYCISESIQLPVPSSLSAISLHQTQRIFQRVSCSVQMTKILEFQLQHRSFEWVFRVDFP